MNPFLKLNRREILGGIAGLLAECCPGIGRADAPVNRSFASLDYKLSKAVADGRATGLAIAVAVNGRLAWLRCYGMADRERGVRVTPRTPFSLASISKPFTAAAVAVLARSHGVSLDKPCRALQGVDAPPLWPSGREATVRELGAHAGGLPTFFEMYPAGPNAREPRPTSELLRVYGHTVFEPGSTYEYSNLGYAALGSLIEQVSGQRFSAFVQDRLITEIGLIDTFLDDDIARLRTAAARYDENGRLIPFYKTATPASGEVYASILDMVKFAAAHMRSKIAPNQHVLPSPVVDDLFKPVLTGATGGATTLGWFRGYTSSGMLTLFKDGGQPGVSTTMYLVPERQFSCIILANRSNNGGLIQEAADEITAAVVPGWTPPSLFPTDQRRALSGAGPWFGHWEGIFEGDGVSRPMTATLMRDSPSVLTIGGLSSAALVQLETQGDSLLASANTSIGTPDTDANNTDRCSLRLVLVGNELIGRMLASAERPGTLALLPFAVRLTRKDGGGGH